MMFVEVEDGTRLFVDAQGDGPPFVALHGAPGMANHVSPKKSYAPLAGEYRVVTYDARGSGRSDGKAPYDHERWVADLEALREHFGFERMVLEGGSYGGFMALEYVLRHPGRVTKLVLRDTAASGRFQEAAKENALARSGEFPDITEELLDRMFDGRLRDDRDFEECFRAVAPLYDAQYDEAKTEEWVRGMVFRAATHNAAFAENLPRYDLRGRLGEIGVPTLVMVGRHDWITPVAASEELASGIPDAKLVVFENSGHSPQIEENEKFIETVRAFLGGTEERETA